jgi:hypothetical protein
MRKNFIYITVQLQNPINYCEFYIPTSKMLEKCSYYIYNLTWQCAKLPVWRDIIFDSFCENKILQKLLSHNDNFLIQKNFLVQSSWKYQYQEGFQL